MENVMLESTTINTYNRRTLEVLSYSSSTNSREPVRKARTKAHESNQI
jgi:hypothetical protein